MENQRTFFNTSMGALLLLCSTLPFISTGCDPCDPASAKAGKCVAAATCADGVKNGDETGVDCGGSCQTCVAQLAHACYIDLDCPSQMTCHACKCMPPTCSDGRKNGSETGVDCGGSCPMACPVETVCHPTKDDPLCASQPTAKCECDLSVAPMSDVCRGDLESSCVALNTCETGKSNNCWGINVPNDGKQHSMDCACIDKIWNDVWTNGAGGEQVVSSEWNNAWLVTSFVNASSILTCSERELFGLMNVMSNQDTCYGTFNQDCTIMNITCNGKSAVYSWLRHQQ